MFLTFGGTIYACGFGVHGQLGTGYVKNLNSPRPVKPFIQTKNELII